MKKISVIIISLFLAVTLMSGGYGFWQEKLIIRGSITVKAPEDTQDQTQSAGLGINADSIETIIDLEQVEESSDNTTESVIEEQENPPVNNNADNSLDIDIEAETESKETIQTTDEQTITLENTTVDTKSDEIIKEEQIIETNITGVSSDTEEDASIEFSNFISQENSTESEINNIETTDEKTITTEDHTSDMTSDEIIEEEQTIETTTTDDSNNSKEDISTEDTTIISQENNAENDINHDTPNTGDSN